MSYYRRERLAGGSYFFTVVTERRQLILTDEAVRLALRAAIVKVRQTRPFRIDGWVLLPDHLHAIWTLPEGDADYATRWQQIKRHVTRLVGRDYFRAEWQTARRAAKGHGTIWQHRYWEHTLADENDLARHLDYLHFNPVKHGLVATAADWPYSSFHRHVAAGRYPVDWAGLV